MKYYINRNTSVITWDYGEIIYRTWTHVCLYKNFNERIDRLETINWDISSWVCTEIIR